MPKEKPKKLTKTEIKNCLWFRFWKLYIRLRDTDKDWWWNCISSWKRLYWTKGQAGHFVPNGSSQKHTRDENNVNFQSYWDNVCKYWNLLWYEDALIKKIGKKYVEYLKSTKNEIKQRKEWELQEMIIKYRMAVIILLQDKSDYIKEEVRLYIEKYEKKMRYELYWNK